MSKKAKKQATPTPALDIAENAGIEYTIHAYDFETVHVSAGRRGLEIELQPNDLAKLIDATFAPIARA